MIVGLGMDIVEVARIERAMLRHDLEGRILTERERSYCLSPLRVAGRWAAKEAVAKAVGIHLTWKQVEILPDATGAPKVVVEHPDFDPVRYRIHLTITHERHYAAATAVVERLVYQVTPA
jgi:holo-[acyl-carrier protein] synthase